MIIKEGFDKIKTCGNYNPILNRSILVSCFLNDDLSKSLWEYNFYSQEDKLTYTFIVDNDEVILKDTGSLMNLKQTPEELKINNLKLNDKEIIAVTKFFIVKKYNEEKLSKIIISIENNNTIIWNVTIVLNNLNIINLKINDTNSEVIQDNKVSPFNFV